MLKHSQGRWSKSTVNSHYNALIWCFLTSQAFLKCCQGPWGYFTVYLLPQLFSPLSLSWSVCVRLQLKVWLTEMLLWSYLHMVWVYIMPSSKNVLFKNNTPDSKPRSNSYEDDHFKTILLLQCNYCLSFTCCFKYCFRVNHSLVLIYHTSFAPHHLFICNSLLSRLLRFSECHFPLRGCSEHLHVLFNYENLIWWKGVLGSHSYPCIIAHIFIPSLYCWVAGTWRSTKKQIRALLCLPLTPVCAGLL